MKNFAMLYKMKKSLQEFRGAFNNLDPEWQKWIEKQMPVNDVFRIHYKLEDLEMDELNIKPFEVEGILDIRQQGGE